MEDHQIEKVAKEVAKATIEALKEDGHYSKCAMCVENHAEQHRFLQDIIGFLDRLNNIRWGIVRTILQMATVSFVALVFTLLWRHFKGG